AVRDQREAPSGVVERPRQPGRGLRPDRQEGPRPGQLPQGPRAGDRPQAEGAHRGGDRGPREALSGSPARAGAEGRGRGASGDSQPALRAGGGSGILALMEPRTTNQQVSSPAIELPHDEAPRTDANGLPAFADDGTDLTVIRWM